MVISAWPMRAADVNGASKTTWSALQPTSRLQTIQLDLLRYAQIGVHIQVHIHLHCQLEVRIDMPLEMCYASFVPIQVAGATHHVRAYAKSLTKEIDGFRMAEDAFLRESDDL